MKNISIILKVTRKCNLRCSYCHDWRSISASMSFLTIANIIKKIVVNSQVNQIDFIWHGGEPLLMPKVFYKKVIFLQQNVKRENQIIVNHLQTNGTLVDDEWCEFFKKYGFNIGLSIDGPESLHNINRKYASGIGSYSDVVNAIDLLKKYEIPFGVLLVINRKVLGYSPKELFDFMSDLNVKDFSFLFGKADNTNSIGINTIETSDYLYPHEFTKFMKGVFDEWYKLNDSQIHIRELTEILSLLFEGNTHACSVGGNCIGQYFSIDPNGNVFHCDNFLGDDTYFLGNIVQDDFDEIINGERLGKIKKADQERLLLCKDCLYFDKCRGGCPHDWYLAKQYFPNYNPDNCELRELINYMNEEIIADLNLEADFT